LAHCSVVLEDRQWLFQMFLHAQHLSICRGFFGLPPDCSFFIHNIQFLFRFCSPSEHYPISCCEFVAHVWESTPIFQPVKVYLSQCSTEIPLSPTIYLCHFCFSIFHIFHIFWLGCSCHEKVFFYPTVFHSFLCIFSCHIQCHNIKQSTSLMCFTTFHTRRTLRLKTKLLKFCFDKLLA